jgi:tetratricopeptide (TPR) repeat protein
VEEKRIDLDPIFAQVKAGDPIGAAYKLAQIAGDTGPGRMFYEAGAAALARRDELGEEALRFARVVFEEAVERDPALGEAHHDLATTMRELGMADDAIRHYRKALELLPDDADALIGLGAAQCDAGKITEAIGSLKRATEAHPESGQAFANLGIALEAAGEDEDAVAAYAKAVQRFDAQLLEADDDETAAEAAARRRWTMIQHAELLERLEKWPQAIVQYRRLHEEEEAIAEAEEQAEEAARDEEESDEEGAEGEEPHEEPPPAQIHELLESIEGIEGIEAPVADGPAEATVEAILPESSVGTEAHDPDHEHDHDHDPDHDHDHDHEHDHDEEVGRLGLERVFVRLVQLGRYDLAFVVLDDLGGEIADARTRANYALYDDGDGLPTIRVQYWGSGERERLDPTRAPTRAATPRRTKKS